MPVSEAENRPDVEAVDKVAFEEALEETWREDADIIEALRDR